VANVYILAVIGHWLYPQRGRQLAADDVFLPPSLYSKRAVERNKELQLELHAGPQPPLAQITQLVSIVGTHGPTEFLTDLHLRL